MANWRNAGHAWQIVNSCELPMLISSDWKIKLPASARAAPMNEWMNDLVHWPSARLSVCPSWGTPTKLLHASVIFLWLVSCVQSVLCPVATWVAISALLAAILHHAPLPARHRVPLRPWFDKLPLHNSVCQLSNWNPTTAIICVNCQLAASR